ncbi:hypothetical protein MKX03_000075, partial [Papaver bracteatum]
MGKLFVLSLVLHCLISVLYYHSVYAIIQTISRGENDDFGGDIDEEVEILNKHVIKTFE